MDFYLSASFKLLYATIFSFFIETIILKLIFITTVNFVLPVRRSIAHFSYLLLTIPVTIALKLNSCFYQFNIFTKTIDSLV